MEAYSNSNVNSIVDAFLENESVQCIHGEKDIDEFLLVISHTYKNAIRGERLAEFDALVRPLEEKREEEWNLDMPF